MGKLVVLNPISAPSAPLEAASLRLTGLSGRAVGFLSNGKPNAEVLLRKFAERLGEQYGIAARQVSKEIPSLAAPAEALAALAGCEAVVLAVAD